MRALVKIGQTILQKRKPRWRVKCLAMGYNIFLLNSFTEQCFRKLCYISTNYAMAIPTFQRLKANDNHYSAKPYDTLGEEVIKRIFASMIFRKIDRIGIFIGSPKFNLLYNFDHVRP